MKLIYAFLSIVPVCGCNAPSPTSGWSASRLSGDTLLESSSPSGASRQALSPEPHATGTTLFVNFLGDLLTSGSDDAVHDVAQLPGATVQVPPLNAKTNAPKMTTQDVTDAIFDRLRTFYLPFDVTLTRTRPTSGSYSMIVIGGTHAVANQPSGVAGVALLDCNNTNPSNVVFDFSDDQPPQFGGVVSVAITAAHESGHSFGLEHTDNPLDLMYSVDSAVPLQSLEDLFNLSFTTGNFSGFSAGSSEPSTELCGRANPLDNSAILLAALGPRPAGGDTVAPSLDWSFPPEMVTSVPTMIPLTITASDDTAVQRVELYKNLELIGSFRAPPYTTTIAAGDKETFYLTVEVLDAAGNRTSESRFYTAETRFPTLCQRQEDCTADRTCQDGYCRLPVGGTCRTNFDCQSSFCKLLTGATVQTCTQACDATTACPAGSSCDGLYCVADNGPTGPTGKTGDPCASESDCASYRCNKTCVPECDDVTFCENGYTCMPVKGGNGCLPSEPVQMSPSGPPDPSGCTVAAGSAPRAPGLLLFGLALLSLVHRSRDGIKQFRRFIPGYVVAPPRNTSSIPSSSRLVSGAPRRNSVDPISRAVHCARRLRNRRR